MIRFHDDAASARAALLEMASRLEATPDDEIDDVCAEMGAGDLETLLRRWEGDLWSDVERLARQSVRFRRALRDVWAYSSERYADRDALLWELGEWRDFQVNAVVYEDHLDPGDPELGWRAIQVPQHVPFAELARVLRSMADWADRAAIREADEGPPAGLAGYTNADGSEEHRP